MAWPGGGACRPPPGWQVHAVTLIGLVSAWAAARGVW